MKSKFLCPFFSILTILSITFSALGLTPAAAAPLNAGRCPSSITVTNNSNSGAGSLRQAIIDVCPAGTITFSADFFIYLTSGQLSIAKSLTIDGSGHYITLDGNYSSGVFAISSGTVTLNKLTIQHGTVSTTPFGGGGIYNNGTLTVTNSNIASNSSTNGVGGGIDNESTLTVINSTISGNSATSSGFFGGAGGIANDGTLTVKNSTFSGNSAIYMGGGIYTAGTATITNSTFSGNSTGQSGGGISNAGTLTVINSSISGNSAPSSGGIENTFNEYYTNIKNTLLSGNPGGNCYGNFFDLGYNLDSGTTCGFSAPNHSMSNTDPKLGPLANNGGLTPTFALLANSPAIDAGNDTVCNDATTVNKLDQRGILRPQGAHCDIGAYELINNTPPTVLSIARASANPTSAASVNFTVTFSKPVTGVDTTGFSLTESGVSSSSISNVSGSGAVYTVTARPGSGSGTLRLNLIDNDTILDLNGNPLGGTGTGNGNFTTGEVYTISTPTVDIAIGGADQGSSSLPRFTFLTRNFAGLTTGPVHVTSSDGSPIFPSQRATSGENYNEVMGLPASQLTTDYWFPAYDHSYIPGSNTNPMRMWVLIGNASNSQSATVNITIGGVLTADSPFSIPPGGRITPRWIGTKGGPVHVVSTNGVNIFTSERVFTYPTSSFNEILGFPASQLTSEYWFPYYDSTSMSNSIQVANTSSSQAAAVDIYIGTGTPKRGSYSIPANGTITQSYAGVVDGPVRVVSTNGVQVVTSQITLSGPNNAFNEVLGYPFNQFATEYWFPTYNHGYIPGTNTNLMRMWVLVGNPSATLAATVDIYIAGVKTADSPFSIPAGGRVTPRWIGTVNGPVRVVSTNSVPIFTSERVLTYPNSVFNEMMGFPLTQMSGEYWFPYYDSVNMSNDILVSRP